MVRELSTGELAKIAGLTIRTLQHYDNIGILRARRQAANGRRVYTESDLMALEQIVFYRSLGFPLEQIKAILSMGDTQADIGNVLSKQKTMLYSQIESLQNGMAAIEASEEIVSIGRTPPWSLLSAFMQSLHHVTLMDWQDYQYSDEQLQVFEKYLPTIEDILEFYRTWKRLSIKAAAFYAAAVPLSSPIARQLALDWQAMTEKVTGGVPENAEAFLDVDRNRDAWSEAERHLIEKAEPYLESLLKKWQNTGE